MNKAAFFDRDGTIIRDAGYLNSLEQIEIMPGVVDLCLSLQQQGYLLFVVTNQSGVARGYFDEKFVEETHRHLHDLFEKSGVVFREWYHCIHHPDYGGKIVCECRKPKHGMLLRLAREYDIDMANSIMIGDKDLDIKAGEAAGCRSFYIQEVLQHGSVKKLLTK